MKQTNLLDDLIERDRRKVLYKGQEGYFIRYSNNMNMILIDINDKIIEVNRNAVLYDY
tara:strand:- start:2627 stop:2800 length:174 start_codon:yes stop_codon:yes gene_type:complete